MLKRIYEDKIEDETLVVDANKEVEDEEEKSLVDPEVITRAIIDQVNGAVTSVWDLIAQINGLIATIEPEEISNKESALEVLNNIVDDLTVNIGMINKVRDIIDEEKTELIDKGEEKAEQLIATE